MIPEQLGPYELIEELGQGGMGVVYRARQASLNRMIALKVLPAHLESDETAVRRFRQEGETAARLKHDNIVGVFDAHVDNPPYYIAMEFLKGNSLADILISRGRLEPQNAVAIIGQICAALEHAHENGVVHRDIKPGNIMVAKNGKATLTDFGIARASDQTRLTSAGAIFGSPDYMSPEQAKGLPVDQRSDIYSLGAVLYEALAGRAPFAGSDPLTVMYRIVHEEPLSPRTFNESISASLEAVVRRAMDKDPRNRFQSCGEMAVALENALRYPDIAEISHPGRISPMPESEPVSPADELSPSPQVFPRRRTLLGTSLAVVMVLLAGIIYVASGRTTMTSFPTASKVPNLIGKNEAEAKEVVESAKFTFVISGKAYDNRMLAGSIIQQDPMADSLQSAGTPISAVSSLGPWRGSGAAPKLYSCAFPGCGRQFSSWQEFDKHYKTKHRPHLTAKIKSPQVTKDLSKVLPFVCLEPNCGQRFASAAELDGHIKTAHNSAYSGLTSSGPVKHFESAIEESKVPENASALSPAYRPVINSRFLVPKQHRGSGKKSAEQVLVKLKDPAKPTVLKKPKDIVVKQFGQQQKTFEIKQPKTFESKTSAEREAQKQKDKEAKQAREQQKAFEREQHKTLEKQNATERDSRKEIEKQQDKAAQEAREQQKALEREAREQQKAFDREQHKQQEENAKSDKSDKPEKHKKDKKDKKDE